MKDINQILDRIKVALQAVARYSVLLFVLVIALVYAYMLLKINQATNVQPAAKQSAATAAPHVDPTVVKQLQQLQDNSVGVKALFSEQRTNPFQ